MNSKTSRIAAQLEQQVHQFTSLLKKILLTNKWQKIQFNAPQPTILQLMESLDLLVKTQLKINSGLRDYTILVSQVVGHHPAVRK